MKPYGVHHVGPVCFYGCCWWYRPSEGFDRRKGHGGEHEPHAKRARRQGKKEIVVAMREMSVRLTSTPTGSST